MKCFRTVLASLRATRWVFFVVGCLLVPSACAPFTRIPLHDACGARRFGPWEERGRPSRDERLSYAHHVGPPADGADAAGTADGLLVMYQRFLRRRELPGQGCPFFPSCSAFARLAFRGHKAPIGFLLTFDRLFIREHYFIDQKYPVACAKNGSKRLYDPVPWVGPTSPPLPKMRVALADPSGLLVQRTCHRVRHPDGDAASNDGKRPAACVYRRSKRKYCAAGIAAATR